MCGILLKFITVYCAIIGIIYSGFVTNFRLQSVGQEA
jgi:hypothetical protein